MKKPFILLSTFVIIIVGLSILQVGLLNRLSTTGIELENLQSQVAKIKKENTILEEKILEASSLMNLSKEAKTIGFVEAKSQIFLTNPLPLAFRQ